VGSCQAALVGDSSDSCDINGAWVQVHAIQQLQQLWRSIAAEVVARTAASQGSTALSDVAAQHKMMACLDCLYM
jgi:hypothetical protein